MLPYVLSIIFPINFIILAKERRLSRGMRVGSRGKRTSRDFDCISWDHRFFNSIPLAVQITSMVAGKRGRPPSKKKIKSKSPKHVKAKAKTVEAKGFTVCNAKSINWAVYSKKRRDEVDAALELSSLGKGIALNARSEQLIGHAVATFIRRREEPGGFRQAAQTRRQNEQDAIQFVSDLCGPSYSIVARIWKYLKDGKIYDSEKQMREKRGKMLSKFSQVPKSAWSFLEKEIDGIINELKGHASIVRILSEVKGRWRTIREKANVAENVCVEFPLKKSSFHCFATQVLNFEYDKVNKILKKLTPKRRRRIRRYIIELSRALQLEKAGTYVIVYMDETYCHQHHAPKRAWMGKEGVDQKDKGPRIIIVQAITRDGILYHNKEDTCHWWTKDDVLNKDVYASELMFPAGQQKKTKDGKFRKEAEPSRGDYHLNMDGHMFMLWVRHRLTPTFHSKYKNGEKMILMLDNARYHHGRSDAYIDCEALAKYLMPPLFYKFGKERIHIGEKTYKMAALAESKTRYPRARVISDGTTMETEETASWMKDLAWTSSLASPSASSSTEDCIVVQLEKTHMRVTVRRSDCFSPTEKKPGENPLSVIRVGDFVKIRYEQHFDFYGAKKEELGAALQKILAEHQPEALRSNLEEWASETGTILLFTPPYCPDLQPIELVWAIVKGRVAREWTKERSLKQTFDHLCNAFYGGPTRIKTRWKPISGNLCNKLIERSLRMAQKRLEFDDLLSGTLLELDESKVPPDELAHLSDPSSQFFDYEFGIETKGTDWNRNFLNSLELANNQGDSVMIFDDEFIDLSDGEEVVIESRHQIHTINTFQ